VDAKTINTQVRLTRRSPAYWRVTIDNPPLNVMGPETVRQFQAVIDELEVDGDVRVVVFDSAVEGYFLNHSDFMARLEDLTSIPAGPTGLPPWPDFLVRLTRAPVASIALIRGRATGNGSELTLACDMSFASREKAIFSQWEVGVGMVAGGGPMARLPQVMGRNRAMEVLLSSEDIYGDQAEAYGYVNRTLADGRDRRSRRRAGDSDCGLRQVGDRQHQAPGQHEPAAGRRDRRRVGRLHSVAGPTRRAGRHQGLDSDWLPKTGRRRNSARFPPWSTGALTASAQSPHTQKG
jgi:enoyl-CoA hydratase/carnithine racemase